jgi:hypothetical protein
MISNFKILFVFFSILNVGACLYERGLLPESSTAQTPDGPNVLWADVIAYAQEHLAHEGYLIQQSDGFAYIKVDDRYIHELFPRLKAEPGYQKPPYFRKNNLPGAHISVIYKDEAVRLSETGQKFKFTLKDLTTYLMNL